MSSRLEQLLNSSAVVKRPEDQYIEPAPKRQQFFPLTRSISTTTVTETTVTKTTVTVVEEVRYVCLNGLRTMANEYTRRSPYSDSYDNTCGCPFCKK